MLLQHPASMDRSVSSSIDVAQIASATASDLAKSGFLTHTHLLSNSCSSSTLKSGSRHKMNWLEHTIPDLSLIQTNLNNKNNKLIRYFIGLVALRGKNIGRQEEERNSATI